MDQRGGQRAARVWIDAVKEASLGLAIDPAWRRVSPAGSRRQVLELLPGQGSWNKVSRDPQHVEKVPCLNSTPVIGQDGWPAGRLLARFSV